MDDYDVYSIAIVDNDEHELFTLTKAERFIKGAALGDHESNLIKGNLSQFISSLPGISKNIKDLQTYTAYFPADATQRLKDGTAIIMRTKNNELLSNVINPKTGKILRQARLQPGMTPVNLALICWQIASVVTAQKYLADIDKKLEAISKDVIDIKRFQKQQFYTEIETELDYIQSIINAFLNNGSFINEFKEIHVHDFVRTYKSISKNIKLLVNEIQDEIQKFQKNDFNKRKNKENIEQFNAERENLTKMIGLLIELTHAQKILSFIYGLMVGVETFANEWEREYTKNRSICENLIGEISILFSEKNKQLGKSLKWNPISMGAALVFRDPLLYATSINNLPHIKAKLNQQSIDFEIKKLRENLFNTFPYIQPNSSLIAFDVDSNEIISNIRYIEKLN